MALNWDVFMQDILKTLGFTSENALSYAKKGSDHPKLWQILEISYLSLSQELLLPYVRDATSRGEDLSVIGFWGFVDSVKNKSYSFCLEMTFTYLHARMLLRCGTRAGDSNAIAVAKSKLPLLFFGRNHPSYREIFYTDYKIRSLASRKILMQIDSTMTASRTHREGHYQGGDALLEEINKEAKNG